MFRIIKDNKIIGVSNGINVVGLVYDEIVEDTEHSLEDYQYNEDQYLLKSDIPVEVKNEQIRLQRQARYQLESDPLKLDYDEALARNSENLEAIKQEWLSSKDKIREELPYIESED